MTTRRSAQVPIAVDVVHECALIRHGLVGMLGGLPGIHMSCEAASPGDYASLPSDARASIVFASPEAAPALGAGLHGPGAARAARLIVVAPGFGDLDVHAALRQGVMGLLLLTVEPDELLTAARRVFLGDHYVTSTVATRLAAQLHADALTSREQEILAFLSDGRCNKSIANELGIAVGTVKTHVKAILSKLEVGSRTEAVVVATRRGIVYLA